MLRSLLSLSGELTVDSCDTLTERQKYEMLSREFEQQLQEMSDHHRHCKVLDRDTIW